VNRQDSARRKKGSGNEAGRRQSGQVPAAAPLRCDSSTDHSVIPPSASPAMDPSRRTSGDDWRAWACTNAPPRLDPSFVNGRPTLPRAPVGRPNHDCAPGLTPPGAPPSCGPADTSLGTPTPWGSQRAVGRGHTSAGAWRRTPARVRTAAADGCPDRQPLTPYFPRLTPRGGARREPTSRSRTAARATSGMCSAPQRDFADRESGTAGWVRSRTDVNTWRTFLFRTPVRSLLGRTATVRCVN